MNEILSVEEINMKFPDEWVAVDEPVVGETEEVLAGRVIGHSPDREVLHEVIMAHRSKHMAVWWTSEWPKEDEAVAL